MVLQTKPSNYQEVWVTKFEPPILNQTNDTFKEKQKTCRKIDEALAIIIYLIGKQGISYWGKREKVDFHSLYQLLYTVMI